MSVHLDDGGGHAYCGYPSEAVGGRNTTPYQGDVTCPACLMRLLAEARTELAQALSEAEWHRARANKALVDWECHTAHDCAMKCCREIEAVLGTTSPVEGARRLREMTAELALLRPVGAVLARALTPHDLYAAAIALRASGWTAPPAAGGEEGGETT